MLLAAVSLAQTQPKYRIVIIPKLAGITYYDAVKTGIDAVVNAVRS